MKLTLLSSVVIGLAVVAQAAIAQASETIAATTRTALPAQPTSVMPFVQNQPAENLAGKLQPVGLAVPKANNNSLQKSADLEAISNSIRVDKNAVPTGEPQETLLIHLPL